MTVVNVVVESMTGMMLVPGVVLPATLHAPLAVVNALIDRIVRARTNSRWRVHGRELIE